MSRDRCDKVELSSNDSVIDTFCTGSTTNSLSTSLSSASGFSEFYSLQRNGLLKMARSLVSRLVPDRPDRIDPEDLVQDVVMKLWQVRDDFRGDCKPTTFIYRLMVRALSARFKKKANEASALVSKSRNSRGHSDILDSLVAEKLDKMPKDRRYKLLIVYRRICFQAEITSIQADIVSLKRDGKTFDQIAKELGFSKATVSRQYEAFKEVVGKGFIFEQERFSDELFDRQYEEIIRKERSH